MDALATAGPPKLPKLSDDQFTESEMELALGPAEHGWADQRWTLARIRVLIAVRFRIDCSMAAVWRLVPAVSRPPSRGARRGRGGLVEEGRVAAGGMTAAALGAFVVFEDEAGVLDDAATSPHLGPAWAYVRGAGAGPVLAPLVAAMRCSGRETSRLIYRPRPPPTCAPPAGGSALPPT